MTTRSQMTLPQSTVATSQTAQPSTLKSPLIKQPTTAMGFESVANAPVSTTPVGKSLNPVQLAVNSEMTIQPILSLPILHYQIAPEYFTQYAQLNSYRVFFRNKYYVFQFEDHRVTNFFEDYYDRN